MTWEESVAWLRAQPDQRELVEACFFDDPLIPAAERFHQSSEWAAIKKLLPDSPGKVLDLGAGRGISSYALAREGWEVTSLEPDPSDLIGAGAIRSLAADSNLPITVMQEWGESLPYSDHSFDLVYGRQVLHHARSLPTLCREAARVLKPGGTFIATREHVVDTPEDMDDFLNGHPLHHLYGGENAFSLPQYLSALESAGFLFEHILAPLESPANYFPATEEQVRRHLESLWDWRCRPELEEAEAEARRSFHAPGRLWSFVARTRLSPPAPLCPDSSAALTQELGELRRQLDSQRIANAVLQDTLCARMRDTENSICDIDNRLEKSLSRRVSRVLRRLKNILRNRS